MNLYLSGVFIYIAPQASSIFLYFWLAPVITLMELDKREVLGRLLKAFKFYRNIWIMELETRPKICMVVGYLSHHDYFLNSADERVILITNQPQLFTNSRKSIILHIGYV